MKVENKKINTITGQEIVVGDKKINESNVQSFSSRLSKASSDNYETKIATLLASIEDQAKKLSKKIDIKELKTYKRLVSEFLDQAVNNSHKFFKENKLDRRGRHRVYAIIKQIDGDLEDLTQEVLKEEKDNLLILQKLDDIRGLILDIST